MSEFTTPSTLWNLYKRPPGAKRHSRIKMNFENNFVPDTTTTEPIKASVRTTTLTETVLVMPDGETINEKFETITTENMVLVPTKETPNEKLELADLLPWDERTKDIILMFVIGVCLLLAIVLGIVIFKWRREKVHVVNGFDMLSRDSSVSMFNSSKIE